MRDDAAKRKKDLKTHVQTGIANKRDMSKGRAKRNCLHRNVLKKRR